MQIADIIETITAAYINPVERQRALFLLGPSGVGKSEAVAQARKILSEKIGDPNFGLIDLRLAYFDPVDFRGVPSVVDGRTQWNPPSFFPKPGTNGILFLDEITSAPPAVQAPAYQITNDRAMGEYHLPDGWMVIAAGNRASDRGVTFNLAAPLLSRMTMIEAESSLDATIDHYITHAVRPEIIAFLKSRPDYLNERDEKINPDCAKLPVGKQFATQRSWMRAAQHYLDKPPVRRRELLSGAVGERAAADFEAFLRVWETMPSIDEAFKHPDKTKVPTDAASRYAVSVGVSMRLDKKNFGKGIEYLNRLPKEFCALAVKLAYKRDSSIAESADFAKWVTDNKNLMTR